jgi:peroxiredoxin
MYSANHALAGRVEHPCTFFRLLGRVFIAMFLLPTGVTQADAPAKNVADVFTRVRQHEFHPLNADGTFTNDRTLGVHGIADLNDDDWRVRLLAIRDLVRLLPDAADDVEKELFDKNLHVRQIAAAALGIARQTTAAGKLEQVLKEDDSPLVRSQAAMSLGQMESTGSLELLRNLSKKDASRDVRHQCELAIDQIEKKRGATDELLTAFRKLNAEHFESVQVGGKAPDFTLKDTEGVLWRLSDANQNGWIVLIWIFADWCPVCHGEFRDLIDMRSQFKDAGVQIVTIECHDDYRGRVMVGKELEPQYWFSKQSFQNKYRTGIWWPHLVDHAGAVGATYGVDPMCFAVHAEYVNRPSTIIIDPKGVIRFAYYGTYWGDRPSIRETLEMIKSERFEFEHKDRRKMVGNRGNK